MKASYLPSSGNGRWADLATRRTRRIGWQLAALLAGLLSALLLALIGVAYLRTRSAALASMQAALHMRATGEMYHLAELGGARRLAFRESMHEAQERGEIFIVFADRQLRVLGASGNTPAGRLADREAALAAVRSGGDTTTSQTGTRGPEYLIYTLAVRARGRTVGVVQTGLSTRSYEGSLHALLESLLLVAALGVLAAAGIAALVAQRALQPIRAALRYQRDFVADAAHELRAPLAIVRTAAELWQSPGSEEDQQMAVEQVLAQVAHLARLVDDLSFLARTDSGAIPLADQRVDLDALAREVVTGMGLLAEERGLTLAIDAEEATVRGDPGRLRQLLIVLLDNALKHTPRGGAVDVRVRRRGAHADLEVRDTGPGITSHDLPHLFDRFYRADRARSGAGAGLGLAIAEWIVGAHRGSIRAGNAPSGGAVFTVHLPLAR